MEAYKQEFIRFMVESDALKFGEFTLKSGRKSPFFMNAGAYVTGSQLKRLGEYYAKAIHDTYGDDFDVLFGPAYKGIPLGVVTAIAYSELYSELEQGTVDGEENPIQTIVLNNYHEVQGEIIQSYHGTMTYILMANLDWFNGLPEDVQEAIVEAEAYGHEESRKAYAEQEQEYLDVVKNAEGVHYYELTDEEIEAFKATVQPVYDSQTAGSEWQADFVQRLQDAFAAL